MSNLVILGFDGIHAAHKASAHSWNARSKCRVDLGRWVQKILCGSGERGSRLR
jgi:hypothetical protein